MKMVVALSVVALAGCAANGSVDVAQLAKPERHLMMPACQSPPYPKDEGNPDRRARWLVEDGQCDSLNRDKVAGLQQYVRAVTSRSDKP